MSANLLDAEIRKFLPLLGNSEKRSILDKIRSLLHIPDKKEIVPTPGRNPSSFDYSKYNFPASAIKFDRGEVNER